MIKVTMTIKNTITDVPGILVGHCTRAATGVTVVLTEGEGAVAGVDVRGSAPCSRELALLDPCGLVQRVQAIVLSGGSVFGLAAADGVVRFLEKQGRGQAVGAGHVAPIVPAAGLFDLGRGGDWQERPEAEDGYRACQVASSQPVPQGNIGAGMGARAGFLKGGVGSASLALPHGAVVGALVVVNSFGSPLDPRTGRLYADYLEQDGEFNLPAHYPIAQAPPAAEQPGQLLQHTTLAVVATNVSLTKPEATKMARMAHDGLARALNPVHTLYDGDIVFALSTGRQAWQAQETDPFSGCGGYHVNQLGAAAADTCARAIALAVLAARSALGLPSFRGYYLQEPGA